MGVEVLFASTPSFGHVIEIEIQILWSLKINGKDSIMKVFTTFLLSLGGRKADQIALRKIRSPFSDCWE
jgi:hypothetical protein